VIKLRIGEKSQGRESNKRFMEFEIEQFHYVCFCAGDSNVAGADVAIAVVPLFLSYLARKKGPCI
jgi:hypothetical protein